MKWSTNTADMILLFSIPPSVKVPQEFLSTATRLTRMSLRLRTETELKQRGPDRSYSEISPSHLQLLLPQSYFSFPAGISTFLRQRMFRESHNLLMTFDRAGCNTKQWCYKFSTMIPSLPFEHSHRNLFHLPHISIGLINCDLGGKYSKVLN